jgi:hypothetical protein
MGASKKNSIPAEKFSLYEKLIATNPKIELKGAANPYTSHNGHMFTFQDSSGAVGIRLPEKEKEEFLKKYQAHLIVSYGVVKKDYVEVPGELLKKTSELKPYLNISLDYVKSLRPKPTTKNK